MKRYIIHYRYQTEGYTAVEADNKRQAMFIFNTDPNWGDNEQVTGYSIRNIKEDKSFIELKKVEKTK